MVRPTSENIYAMMVSGSTLRDLPLLLNTGARGALACAPDFFSHPEFSCRKCTPPRHRAEAEAETLLI